LGALLRWVELRGLEPLPPTLPGRLEGVRESLENVKIKCHTPLAPRVSGLVVAGYCRIVWTVVVMGSSGNPYRARRHQREQQRRQHAQRTSRSEARSPKAGSSVEGRDGRTAATACGWCGGPITPGRRGPIPKWCSATCRHRAWEQARAAASGLSAVELVERRIEVQVPLVPTRRDWPGLLSQLASQLNDGRIYDRDLPALARALEPLLQAYRRRAHMTGAPDVR
jgi:hypothetical protein